MFLRRNAFVYAVLLGSIYGGTIELLQKYIFTSRSAEWGDEAANITGCLIGISFYYFWERKVKKTA